MSHTPDEVMSLISTIEVGGHKSGKFDSGRITSMLRAYAAILERPVVVEDDDDGMPVGYAGWYNRKFAGQPVDVTRDHHCEEAWRACLESMVRGKS